LLGDDPAVDPQSPDIDDFALHAWVDESMRAPSNGRPGMYLMAAVVADPAACDETRDSLRALRLGKAKRLHWRHESEPRQQKIAALVAELDAFSIVVVGVPLDSKRQERARRQCMERLVYELDQIGVTAVLLESRHSALNARDKTMAAALYSRAVISSELRVEFALPHEEPMLWVPDAVAGIVNAYRSGGDDALRLIVGSVIREIDVELS
jgi:RNase H-fold protein (predicted Holliday junction resolvase)